VIDEESVMSLVCFRFVVALPFLLFLASSAIHGVAAQDIESCLCSVECDGDDELSSFVSLGSVGLENTQWQCRCNGGKSSCTDSSCTSQWLQNNAFVCGGNPSILFGSQGGQLLGTNGSGSGSGTVYPLFQPGCRTTCRTISYTASELQSHSENCECGIDGRDPNDDDDDQDDDDDIGAAFDSFFSSFPDDDDDDDDSGSGSSVDWECGCASQLVYRCECQDSGCQKTSFLQCLTYSSCPLEPYQSSRDVTCGIGNDRIDQFFNQIFPDDDDDLDDDEDQDYDDSDDDDFGFPSSIIIPPQYVDDDGNTFSYGNVVIQNGQLVRDDDDDN